MLQKIDKDRLDKVLKLVESAEIRFPVAEFARVAKLDKGNVSAYLNGKKPMSDNFFTTIIDYYQQLNKTDLSYTEQRRNHKNNGTGSDVPVYGGFTTLGNIDVYDDENMKHEVIAKQPVLKNRKN